MNYPGDNRFWVVCYTAAAVSLAGGCSVIRDVGTILQGPGHFMDRGHAFLEQGLSDSALAAFGMALEADPKLVGAHLGMGDIFRERGDYDMASRAYERAVNLAPNSYTARYNYGWMQHLMGNIQDAINSYLHALTISPESFEANLNLAAAYLQLGRPADALPYAIRATELRGEDQSAWANLAAAYTEMGWYDEAVEAYRQALEFGDAAPPILMGLANVHIRLKHYDRAINVLEALNRDEPSAEVFQLMGYAYFKSLRFEQSLDSYRAALVMGGEDTVALNGVGVCLMALYLQSNREDIGQRDEALAVWRRSLRLEPGQSHIVDLLARYQRL